ncbi:MAG: sn-glycerol-3-phosphate ABC transporter ATP-binding protein UgpC [Clostridia bacterium]|nr:sn-glycerol-3-phosphate ABC transporter ATP-binding protein UgpC [Clostridia bacterium]
MASITLKNVDKTYDGDVKAVSGFDLEIKDKEFVIFVGPSGCGKSTTLRMIAGLEEISSGEIYIGDRLVNYVEPRDRDIAMVFQSYALYRHMTVYKNMAFSLKMHKVPKEEIDRRVRETAEMLGLTHLLDRKPGALSGGECQRVALGRALVRSPSVFLLDEPLSNLDAKLRSDMRAEIIKLHKKLQTTFVYVTHDQTEAMTMGDRIVIMKKGLIQQVDSPKDIYDHPKNKFVAGFIGTPQMNFFDGEIKTEGGRCFAEACGSRFAIDGRYAAFSGRKVCVGVRPEHMELCAGAAPENVISGGRIELVELLGSDINVHASLGDIRFVVRSQWQSGLEMGSAVNVRVDTSRIHIFDAETEENLAMTETEAEA